mmetsp:Transcript_29974/g.54357  ORF Transcript_29974/g.54357 Transcript_29974/m.54357 type:complete len:93 (+) Transcript_29974:1495-1773(+)
MATNRAVGVIFLGALRVLGLVTVLSLLCGEELNNALVCNGDDTLLGWKLLSGASDVLVLNALADGAPTNSIATASKGIIMGAVVRDWFIEVV